MRTKVVFPGSFDPIHIGHVDIVQRALPLFDELIIAIGINTQKKYLFPLAKRKEWIERIFRNDKKVKVETYRGLTVDYCESIGSRSILRGLRSSADFEFERAVSQMNHAMNRGIETIFFLSNPGLSMISSSIIRDILINGGDSRQFIPEEIETSFMYKSLDE